MNSATYQEETLETDVMPDGGSGGGSGSSTNYFDISGFVYYATDLGDSLPLRGATVRYYNNSNELLDSRTTTISGKFAFSNLSQLGYLSISCAGYITLRYDIITASDYVYETIILYPCVWCVINFTTSSGDIITPSSLRIAGVWVSSINSPYRYEYLSSTSAVKIIAVYSGETKSTTISYPTESVDLIFTDTTSGSGTEITPIELTNNFRFNIYLDGNILTELIYLNINNSSYPLTGTGHYMYEITFSSLTETKSYSVTYNEQVITGNLSYSNTSSIVQISINFETDEDNNVTDDETNVKCIFYIKLDSTNISGNYTLVDDNNKKYLIGNEYSIPLNSVMTCTLNGNTANWVLTTTQEKTITGGGNITFNYSSISRNFVIAVTNNGAKIPIDDSNYGFYVDKVENSNNGNATFNLNSTHTIYLYKTSNGREVDSKKINITSSSSTNIPVLFTYTENTVISNDESEEYNDISSNSEEYSGLFGETYVIDDEYYHAKISI